MRPRPRLGNNSNLDSWVFGITVSFGIYFILYFLKLSVCRRFKPAIVSHNLSYESLQTLKGSSKRIHKYHFLVCKILELSNLLLVSSKWRWDELRRRRKILLLSEQWYITTRHSSPPQYWRRRWRGRPVGLGLRRWWYVGFRNHGSLISLIVS